jgi:hypothetical protein
MRTALSLGPNKTPSPGSRKTIGGAKYPLATCRFHARLDAWHSHTAAGDVQKARFACL